MTLKELKELVLSIRKNMRKAKIPCGKVDEIKFARKNAKYFGITKIKSNLHYDINISQYAIKAGKESLYNTIYHELIHTCMGCMNHGVKFKKYGDIVYNVFGYKIETYCTEEEENVINHI